MPNMMQEVSMDGLGMDAGVLLSGAADAAVAQRKPVAAMVPAERERQLVAHLPMVRYLARRIHERLPQHVDLDDLVSAGVVGLMDAFNKFDHNKQVQFKSYAQFRVRGAILDSLRMMDWSVCVRTQKVS